MKILAIRILNLASLDGETVIDFTTAPLATAGIFAITGPTGAGKSTILDALCLALYAKTPRYRSAESGVEIRDVKGSFINQSDIRGILRDGTSEGAAEVDFVGIDDEPYKARWYVRRAHMKAAGSLQSDNVQLTNLRTGAVFPAKKRETLEEIERVVGLNFEQFTRSVLLAQGDFTAFLKAGKDEKSALLEKLTGTYIYSEISRATFERSREEALVLRDLHQQKQGIAILSDEEKVQMNQELEELEQRLAALELQRDEIAAGLNWHQQLQSIEKAILMAKGECERVNRELELAAPRSRKLGLVTAVRPLAAKFTELQQLQRQLDSWNKEKSDLSQALLITGRKKEELHKHLEESRENLINARSELEHSQPLLRAARSLDVKILELGNQLNQVEQENAHKESEFQQFSKLVVQKEANLSEIAEALKGLEQWIRDNEIRKPVADESALIVHRLNEGQVNVRKLADTLSITAELTAGLTAVEKEFDDLSRDLAAEQDQRQSLSDKCGILEEKLSAYPLSPMEEKRSAAELNARLLLQAAVSWNDLAFQRTELKRLNEEQTRLHASIASESVNSRQLQEELVSAEISKNTAEKLLNAAILASAESVITLREKLVTGEACPVCGSTEHPYATQLAPFEHFLDTQREEYSKIETEYLACHQRLIGCQARLANYVTEQERICSEIAGRQPLAEELEQAWHSSHGEAFRGIPEEEISSFIEKKRDLRDTELQTLTADIRQAYADREVLQEYQQGLKKLDDSMSRQQVSLQNLNNRKASLSEKLELTYRERDNLSAALQDLQDLLSKYFNGSGWFENWKSNPEVFAERITTFTRQWKQALEQREIKKREHATLHSVLEGMYAQRNSMTESSRQTLNKLHELSSRNSTLNKQRSELFDGVAADEVEQAFKLKVTEAESALTLLQGEMDSLNADFARFSTLNASINGLIDGAEGEKLIIERFMKTWLDDFNLEKTDKLSMESLLELLVPDQLWIEQERSFINLLQEQVSAANTVLAERISTKNELLEARTSTRTEAELGILLDNTKDQLREGGDRCARIKIALNNDRESSRKIAGLLQRIDEQSGRADGWARLNEVIGSADGKKFRQIAQEYTLDVLLGYANVHLSVLSTRYVLQRIDNSLSLQVVDKDMGDEIRTVFSLSGGESFLVSLALALGLASLSSSKMKVESLFIDEGFGSLDPVTLNIAMDALERLHDQGRKVGVISHVQEMTERIAVQIQVNKQPGGKSIVQLAG